MQDTSLCGRPSKATKSTIMIAARKLEILTDHNLGHEVFSSPMELPVCCCLSAARVSSTKVYTAGVVNTPTTKWLESEILNPKDGYTFI